MKIHDDIVMKIYDDSFTLGKAVTRDLAAIGVQNKFDRIIFSSSTLCSFSTAIAFMTVFPVPTCA